MPVTIVEIACGGSHTCAILKDRQISCWGSGAYGQLGNGRTNNVGTYLATLDSLRQVPLGSGRNVTKISLGGRHTCVILDRGDLKCFGSNRYGQLGLEDTIDRGDTLLTGMGDALPKVSLGVGRTAVEVATGLSHTCVLLDNHEVKCFGHNSYGELGLGDIINRGGRHGSMGDDLPSVDLGTNLKPIQITAGAYHTCVLLVDVSCSGLFRCKFPNKVACWGLGKYGQLGLGTTTKIADQADELGEQLRTVNLGTNDSVTSVKTGSYHTCAVFDFGGMKCWGRNNHGQLGSGNLGNVGDRPGEMGNVLKFVNVGKNRRVLNVVLGAYHTCVLLDNGGAKCFGNNVYGQLGYGDTLTRGDKASTMGDHLQRIDFRNYENRSVVSMSAGDEFCCALFNDSTAECWGHNSFGQLGLGDMLSHLSPAKVSWIGKQYPEQHIVTVDDGTLSRTRGSLVDANPVLLAVSFVLLGVIMLGIGISYCKYCCSRKRVITVPLDTGAAEDEISTDTGSVAI